MPYCKSVAVHANVKQSLRYILNPDKTDNRVLTSSINCMTEPEFAYTAMSAVYDQYAKDRFNSPPPKSGKGTVKTIHYIMSFADSENVTPELAHKIGKALVRKMFGDDAVAVIATHVNAEHIHNHILVCSYSLSGQKFYDNKATVRKMRETTNGVCRAFGITPALNFENEGRSMNYSEWQHKKKGTSWKEQIRQEIDRLIPAVNDLDELLGTLEERGYKIKRDKYLYIKAPGQKRSVSLWRLGEDYTEYSLNARILWRAVGNGSSKLRFTSSEIERAYLGIISKVRILAAENRKVQRRADNNAPYSMKNDLDVFRLSAQLTVINRDRILSIGDLEGRIKKISAEYSAMQEQLAQKLLEQEKLLTLIEQCEYYYANRDNSDLTVKDINRLEIIKNIMRENDISSPQDLIALRCRNNDLLKNIADTKDMLSQRKNKLVRYVDICDTYNRISRGDYISYLVEEEKRRREQEKQKENNKPKKRKGR